MAAKFRRWQPGYFKSMLTGDRATIEKRKKYVKDKKEQVRLAKLVRLLPPALFVSANGGSSRRMARCFINGLLILCKPRRTHTTQVFKSEERSALFVFKSPNKVKLTSSVSSSVLARIESSGWEVRECVLSERGGGFMKAWDGRIFAQDDCRKGVWRMRILLARCFAV